MNSSWRWRASSTGFDAMSPMVRAPKNMARTSTGPAITSARATTASTCWALERLSPATTQLVPVRAAISRNGLLPKTAVVGWPERDQAPRGSGGAPWVSAVASPSALARHTTTGASSTSRSAGSGPKVATPSPPSPVMSRSLSATRASTWATRCLPSARLKGTVTPMYSTAMSAATTAATRAACAKRGRVARRGCLMPAKRGIRRHARFLCGCAQWRAWPGDGRGGRRSCSNRPRAPLLPTR